MAFCDWFSGFVNLDISTFHDGRIMYLKNDGSIEYEINKPLSVLGSYDDKVIVKSSLIPASPDWSLDIVQDEIWRVYISGNPTKFLQGHNVYGHPDILSIIHDFVKQVLIRLQVDIFTINRVLKDNILITRLDITSSYVMDSPSDVKLWLRSASQYMTGKNQKVDNDKAPIGKYQLWGETTAAAARKIIQESYAIKEEDRFSITQKKGEAFKERLNKLTDSKRVSPPFTIR